MITRSKIVDIIYKKLSKTATRLEIRDSVDVIVDYLISKISDNEPISIKNFGTFITYKCKGHKGVNIYTGEHYSIEPSIHVKFLPSDIFLKLLKSRRKGE